MRHIAWAVTWMVVGLATMLATTNVLTHSAQLRRAANPPAIEPAVPAPESTVRPMAKARPPAEFGRSVIHASYRQRDRD
jgi:hypothetical protein